MEPEEYKFSKKEFVLIGIFILGLVIGFGSNYFFGSEDIDNYCVLSKVEEIMSNRTDGSYRIPFVSDETTVKEMLNKYYQYGDLSKMVLAGRIDMVLNQCRVK